MSDVPRDEELEFRDGKRFVPEYLAALMADLETHRMTYTEAVAAANRKTEADWLNAQRESLLVAHFRELR